MQNEMIDIIGVTKGKGFKGEQCIHVSPPEEPPNPFLVCLTLSRCHCSLAYKETATENTQGSEESCLYRGLASQ